jgi:hypothetical protein
MGVVMIYVMIGILLVLFWTAYSLSKLTGEMRQLNEGLHRIGNGVNVATVVQRDCLRELTNTVREGVHTP